MVQHNGVDIGADPGTWVLATADGKISYAGHAGELGNTVVLDHGFGIVTRYAHSAKLVVKTGQDVHRGERIAVVGSTGRSTGPHVHYEVIVDDEPVDPMPFLMNTPLENRGNVPDESQGIMHAPHADKAPTGPVGGDSYSSPKDVQASRQKFLQKKRVLLPIKLAMAASVLIVSGVVLCLIRGKREDELKIGL